MLFLEFGAISCGMKGILLDCLGVLFPSRLESFVVDRIVFQPFACKTIPGSKSVYVQAN